jgi:hypothetical protein
LTTVKSETFTIRIIEITEDSVRGMDLRAQDPTEREIGFSDISQASTEKFDIGDSSKVAGAYLGTVILIFFAIAAATFGGA